MRLAGFVAALLALAAAVEPAQPAPRPWIDFLGPDERRVPSTSAVKFHAAIRGRGLPGAPIAADFLVAEASVDGRPWGGRKRFDLDLAVDPAAPPPLYNMWGARRVSPGRHTLRLRLVALGDTPLPPLPEYESREIVLLGFTPRIEVWVPPVAAATGAVPPIRVQLDDFGVPADGLVCVSMTGAAPRCFDDVAAVALPPVVLEPGRAYDVSVFLATREREVVLAAPVATFSAPRDAGGLRQLRDSELSVFSQNGEDGVLQALFALYPPVRREYVEFGVEDGSETNTRFLRERDGWHGLLLDGGHSNASINLQQEFIRADNIVGLFRKYGVSADPDLLSVDIDRNDFWVLQAILEAGYRPRVVVTEVNAHFPPEAALVVPHEPDLMWDGTVFYGATPAAMRHLLAQFGYTMVYCESHGVNCFSVRDDVLGRSMLADFPIEAIHRPHHSFGAPTTVARVDREGRGWLEVH